MIKLMSTLLLFTSCSSLIPKEGAKVYLTSTKLTAIIRAGLVKRQGLNAFDIKILTQGKKVTLSGDVDYLHQKLLAYQLALDIAGKNYEVLNLVKIRNQ